LLVKDIEATASFYKLLELDIEVVSESFARATWGDGPLLEFGTPELTASYDANAQLTNSRSSNTIGIEYSHSSKVDAVYTRAINAGHVGHIAPCDPPWQARFAIIKDPDGNQIGLHGPRSRTEDIKREQSTA